MTDSKELWTAEVAGRNCPTKQSPNGVSAVTYRYYVSQYGAPKAVSRDLETGEKLYDPEAVKTWHAGRRGQGYRTDLEEKS